MKIRLASSLQSDSILDGNGIRTVIWTQGCLHNCKGCHNPETHSFTDGYLVDVEEIKEEISNLKYQDGITLSGGEPLLQGEACLAIAKHCQEIGLNVWCYTGFTYDQIQELSKTKPWVNELLENIDVLVDGKFVLEKKSYNVKFRGSTNQRLIDMKKTLASNKVVELECQTEAINKYLNHEVEYIYV